MNRMKRGQERKTLIARIGKLAQNKFQRDNDPEYNAIRLNHNDTALKSYKTSVFDVFKLSPKKTQRGTTYNITIVRTNDSAYKEATYFVIDNETMSLYTYIPDTEWNRQVLASHFMDKIWSIDRDDVLEDVKARAEKIEPLRDAIKERGNSVALTRTFRENKEKKVEQEKELEWQQSQDMETLRRENDSLRSEMKNLKDMVSKLVEGNADSKSKLKTNEPQKDSEVDQEIYDKAKDKVEKEDPEFVEKMKKKSDKYWLTKEYKKRIAEEVEAMKEAA